MTSLEIITFKKNLEDYISSQNFPAEIKRMVLEDIYKKVAQDAFNEAMNQAKEKEKTNVSTDQDEV